MSQYGIIYRMEFKNREGFTVRVNISPTDVLIPDIDIPQIIPLTGSGTPVIISASNNDEDKFTQIRSKSAKIQFRTDMQAGLDSSTFSKGGDNLWVCDIILQDTPEYIFRGYLMMADNQQPFQPDPQYVTLTATDHLAALKEIKLQDLSGLNPVGRYRMADLITFCLRKTGLSLQLYVVNNLRAGGARFTRNVSFNSSDDSITMADTKGFYVGQRIVISGTVSNNLSTFVTSVFPVSVGVTASLVNESAPTAVILDYNSQFHWYDVVRQDALTYEGSTIGISEDCYTVLEKILAEDCYITQWKGNWWIFRVDEMEDNPVYVAHFDQDGVYVDTAAGTQIDYNIGAVNDSKFANADTLLRFVRPEGFVQLSSNYSQPIEVPCNNNFARGAQLTHVGTTRTYTLDCLDLLEGFPGAHGSVDGTTGFIQRDFNSNDYEVDRFIVVTPRTTNESGSSQPTYFQTKIIPLNVKDKFTSSIDLRLTSITSGLSAMRIFRMILHGIDGSYWILGRPSDTAGTDDTVQWYDTAGWTLNTGRGKTTVDFGNSDWQGITWDAPPAPIAGDLYMWINQLNQSSSSFDNQNGQYANLRFDYIPFINGSYQKYSGQRSRIDRIASGYIANRDKEVFTFDSPAKLFKGSMTLLINGAEILFPYWFNAAPFGNSYPPNTDYLLPYGYIQAFSVWNQYKGYNEPVTNRGIGINIFSGSVKGLTDNWPDLIHRYNLTDYNVQTANRYFMLISLEQDWKSCIWTATLIEVYNRVIYKSYNDPFTFKYLSE